jgi:hypothetical protein
MDDFLGAELLLGFREQPRTQRRLDDIQPVLKGDPVRVSRARWRAKTRASPKKGTMKCHVKFETTAKTLGDGLDASEIGRVSSATCWSLVTPDVHLSVDRSLGDPRDYPGNS